MKISLNVATSPQENHRPFIAAASACGAITLIALVLLSHAAYASWRANLELRADIARLESQIQTNEAKQQDLRTFFRGDSAQGILDRADFLNSLIAQRTFPWTKIFMDLENTLPPGVRVISISPKLEEGRASVTMEVGATDEGSKLKFLEAMEKSKNFSGINVHDERVAQSPTEPDKVRVNLTFWYEMAS